VFFLSKGVKTYIFPSSVSLNRLFDAYFLNAGSFKTLYQHSVPEVQNFVAQITEHNFCIDVYCYCTELNIYRSSSMYICLYNY
jgi:hypothetical protein